MVEQGRDELWIPGVVEANFIFILLSVFVRIVANSLSQILCEEKLEKVKRRILLVWIKGNI